MSNKLNSLQLLFVSTFIKMLQCSTHLKKRDFIFIVPSESQNEKLLFGMYDVKTGIGYASTLLKFLTVGFTEQEVSITIDKLLNGVIQTIKTTNQKDWNVIDVSKFSIEHFGHRAVLSDVVSIGESKVYIYDLKKINKEG